MKANTLYRIATVFAIGLAMLVSLFAVMQTRIASAQAPFGLPATVSTTSSMVIGPNIAYNTVLKDYLGTTTNETSFLCSSRIISTTGSAIMLMFSSSGSTTLSGSIGNYQAASTTMAYDGGLYGCGYWTFYAYATTTVAITQTR